MSAKQWRLGVELIPRPLFGVSLYRLTPSAAWREFRLCLLEDGGLSCRTCGAEAQRSADLQAHEMWTYDESERVARLADVKLVCKSCHAVEHFGNTLQRVREGTLSADYLPVLRDHWARVNAVSVKAFEAHVREAEAIWLRRSKLDWQVDFGDFADRFPSFKFDL